MTVEHMIEILRRFPNSRFGDPRHGGEVGMADIIDVLEKRPEIIHCWECKYWRQQTNYAGVPLSFGFCESDDMWQSLCGETYEVDTDDDFYCGFAKRREK